MSGKELQCKEKNISFHYTINRQCISLMNEVDLALLLINSLDNAIENIAENNREIYLDIKEDHNAVIMKVENSVDIDVLKENPTLESQKKDKKAHGYGITSLKMLVEKYKGNITFTQKEDRFYVLMYFPL